MGEAEAEKTVREYEAANPVMPVEPDGAYQIAKHVLAAWKQPPEPELVLEQTIIAFGPLAMVPFPFEVFSVFTLRLRKFGPYQYNLLCSNTNGRNAYLPDRGSFALGGCEPECLKNIRPFVIRPDAGDIAVSQSLAALEKAQA
ncbi:MAG: hypothetical protein IJU70_05465 [Lentisphaeria bacterium]|nr:hypothetical protein [Lentisphaeria bacterium]